MFRPLAALLCSATLLAAQPGPRPAAPPGPTPRPAAAPQQPGWEWTVTTVGKNDVAATKQLTEFAAHGWEYAGPLAGDRAAFRRPADDPAARAAVVALQGSWSTTGTESNVRNPDRGGGLGNGGGDPEQGFTLTYAGSRYALKDPSGFTVQAGTFTVVAPAGDLKQIDYHCTEGGYRGLRFRAVYAVTADEHRVCSDYGNDLRPAALDGKGGFLRTLTRVK